MMAETQNATGGNPAAFSNSGLTLAENATGIVTENELTRKTLRAMTAGTYTPNGTMPNFGAWQDFMRVAHDAYAASGAAGVRAVVNVNPAAMRLLSSSVSAPG